MLSDITVDMISVHLEDGSTIECSRALLEEVRRLAVTGLVAFGRGGLEVGGVLYGLREGNRLTIHAFAECPCEHSTGPAFVLSANDRQALAQVIRPPAGLETLGWYRTHTRRGLDLDASDRELFDRFPLLARTIGLVLKPARLGASAGAFYLRETTGEIAPRSPREFTVEPPERSVEQVPAPIAESEPQMQSASLADPWELAEHPAKLRWPAVAGLVAALIAVVAGAVYYRTLPPHAFALKAYAIAPGQIRISWNHGAVPAVDGASGALEIRDGDDDTQILLEPAQLRLSGLTYTQKTGRLDVILRVSRRDSTTPVEDSIEFLGPPAPGAAAPPPIPAVENNHAPVSAAIIRKVVEPAPDDSAKRQVQAAELAAKTAAVQAPVLPAPPPPVTSTSAQAGLPDLLPKAEIAPEPAPQQPEPLPAPRSGRLIWTGKLDPHAVVEINGAHASFGSVIGSWPGGPADFRVDPAEFTSDGLVIFTTDGAANGRTEPPSKSNGRNPVSFAFDPLRVGQLVVLEAPNQHNNFNRIVLRSDAKTCPVIVVDWKAR
jgi:hypothetical protein